MHYFLGFAEVAGVDGDLEELEDEGFLPLEEAALAAFTLEVEIVPDCTTKTPFAFFCKLYSDGLCPLFMYASARSFWTVWKSRELLLSNWVTKT